MTGKLKRAHRSHRFLKRRAPQLEPLEIRLALTCSVGENCPPDLDLSTVDTQTVSAGQTVNLDFGSLVTDVDDQGAPTGDVITFRLDPDASNLDGAPDGASITPAGVFTWTPTQAQQGTHVITVIVIDQGTPRRADAETFTVIVEEGNDAPIAQDDEFSTDEDTPITSGNLLDDNGAGPDSDPDSDPIIVTAFDASSAGGATVNVNS
ncbi:MAG: hypothetical protein KDA42_07630, partial [Planctomycetales bacterium]|nr:hypothetical protein [Planctomycetales bacterium]